MRYFARQAKLAEFAAIVIFFTEPFILYRMIHRLYLSIYIHYDLRYTTVSILYVLYRIQQEASV